MAKKREYVCKVCGKKYLGFRRAGTCSIDCSRKYLLKTISQLRNKRGKIYEKWKMNITKALAGRKLRASKSKL